MTPAFVKRHPDGNRREKFQMFDCFCAFSFPLLSRSLILSGKQGVVRVFQGKLWKQSGQVADNRHTVFASTVYHVLTDNHSKPVAMIVPSGAFHLDMFAHHIKAQCFHGGDVVNQRFVRGRGVQSVWPVALVQHAHQKAGFVV